MTTAWWIFKLKNNREALLPDQENGWERNSSSSPDFEARCWKVKKGYNLLQLWIPAYQVGRDANSHGAVDPIQPTLKSNVMMQRYKNKFSEVSRIQNKSIRYILCRYCAFYLIKTKMMSLRRKKLSFVSRGFSTRSDCILRKNRSQCRGSACIIARRNWTRKCHSSARFCQQERKSFLLIHIQKLFLLIHIQQLPNVHEIYVLIVLLFR